MKYILTIAILILNGLTLLAQKQSTYTEIDTIESYASKTLVEYRIYLDSNLTQKATAFFYPTVIKIPRFRFLQKVLQTKIQADSIVYHGERIEYKENGFYHPETYENGAILNSLFYDSSGQEISESEYKGNKITIGPCRNEIGHYFLHRNKKKN